MPLEQAGLEWVNKNLPGFVSDINKANTATGKASEGLEGVAGAATNAGERLRDSKGKFIGAGGAAEGAGTKFSALGSIITGVATGMTTFALDAVVGLGKALIGLGKGSIDVAKEFESSMAVLGIAASSTGLGMEDLSEAALAVGGDTRLLGVSASGAAESMTGLFKAGLTSQEVFGDLQGYMEGTADLGGTLRASIDLAAATTLDMVTASDVAAVTLATFGSEAEKAGISTDVWIVDAMNNLVMAADASVAEVGPLVEALKMVGPQASAMSIPLADVNNALAIMSTRGKQGTMAGTGLNRMLLDLVKGTPKATEMMEALGIAVYDNQGTMLPLVDIIGQFEIALEDATDAERDAALAAIFTTQGAATMNTMLEEGVQGWTDMAEATANAATMQEQAAAKGETLAAQQEALAGVIETLQIKIGSALLPALTSFVSMGADLVEQYGPKLTEVFEFFGSILSEKIVPAVETFIGYLTKGHGPLTAFLAALGRFGLSEFANKISRIVQIFYEDFLPVLQKVGRAFSEAFGKISAWFDANQPAIEAALLTIQRVFQDTFGAVVSAFQEAWPELQAAFETIKEAFASLGIEFGDSGSTIETVAKVISAIIIGVGTVVSGVFRAVTAVVSFFAEHFKESLETAINIATGFKEWIQGVMDVIGGIFTGDWERVKKGFLKSWRGMAKTLGNIVKGIVKGIIFPFKAVAKFIGGFVKGIIKFFKDLAKKLVGGSIIPDMMAKIARVITGFLDKIKKVWEDVWNAVKEFVSDVWSKVEKFIDTVSGNIQKAWEDFTGAVQEIWEDVWEAIEEFVDEVWNDVQRFIDEVSGDIQQAWEDFTEAVQEIWEDVWEAIEEFVDEVWNNIQRFIDDVSGDIQRAWETFTEAVQEIWEDAWEAIEEFVNEVWENIERFIDTVSGNIQRAWETFTEAVQEAWENIWEAIEELVNEVWSNIETFIGTVSGNIQRAWETFTGDVEEFWGTMWGNIQSAVEEIFAAIETFVGTISGNIQTAWETFTGAVETFWSGMWEAIEGFVSGPGNIFESIETALGTISTNIQIAWETFTGAIETFWSDMWGVINDFLEADGVFEGVATAIDTISTNIRTAWETFTGALSTAWSTLFNSLKGIVDGAMILVNTAIDTALRALVDIIAAGGEVWNSILSIGTKVVDAIRNGVSNAWNTITTFLENLFKGAVEGKAKLIDAVTSAWAEIKTAGSKIIDGIKAGIEMAWSTIIALLRNLMQGAKEGYDGIKQAAINAWEKIKEAGQTIIDAIKAGILAHWTNFITWLKNLIGNIFSSPPTDAAIATGMRGGAAIVNGIAQGIQNNAWVVQNTLSSMISGLSIPPITIPVITISTSAGVPAGVSVGQSFVTGIARGVESRIDYVMASADRLMMQVFGASEPKDPKSPFRSSKLKKVGEQVGVAIADNLRSGMEKAGITPDLLIGAEGGGTCCSLLIEIMGELTGIIGQLTLAVGDLTSVLMNCVCGLVGGGGGPGGEGGEAGPEPGPLLPPPSIVDEIVDIVELLPDIVEALPDMVEFLPDLIGEIVDTIERLPDDVIPGLIAEIIDIVDIIGGPPGGAFFDQIAGIIDTVESLPDTVEGLYLTVPPPSQVISAVAPPETEIHIGPITINNDMDMAEFEYRVQQAVATAI